MTSAVSRSTPPFDWRGFWLAVLPPIFGLGLLIGVWALVSISTASSIPSPTETFKQAVLIFSDPFYRKGPNDQGVGWNILASLKRVAVGTAWLVIVAAEMLTGGVGIGFWVWDEWNNLNVKNIIIAIFVIGIVGLILEYALIKIATAFTFEEVKT